MTSWIKHPNAKALVRAPDNDPYSVAPLAGRALDAEVAEKVMGFRWHKWEPTRDAEGLQDVRGHRFLKPGSSVEDFRQAGWNVVPFVLATGHEPVWEGDNSEVPNYSTDISAAWPVLDWLRSQRDVVCLTFDSRDNRWEIDACEHIDYKTNKRDDGSAPRGWAVIVSAETAPLAICKASLRLRELGS